MGKENRIFNVIIFITLLVFSIIAYFRNIIWKDELTLWKEVSVESPNKGRGYNEIGVIYSEKGFIDEAINRYTTALKFNPNHPGIHSNLGNAYFRKGLINEAVKEYLIALKIKTNFPETDLGCQKWTPIYSCRNPSLIELFLISNRG